jgi:hypothetical protein
MRLCLQMVISYALSIENKGIGARYMPEWLATFRLTKQTALRGE